MSNGQRDAWDKASIVLQPVGGLLTAIAVAIVGYTGSQFLERQQAADSNIRLYSELMSRREQAETDLREAMFASIIQSFLKPNSTTLESRLVNLELLTYNFHESLELKPLFLHLKRQIAAGRNLAALRRLEHLARDVTARQMVVLEEAGPTFDRTVDLDGLRSNLRRDVGGLALEAETLTLDGITRSFQIFVEAEDRDTREFRVRLAVRTNGEERGENREFAVGFFDFPMIDNTRLSHDQRCAIVVNALDDHSADLSLVLFPGTRASLREKPYYDDVVQGLVASSASPKALLRREK